MFRLFLAIALLHTVAGQCNRPGDQLIGDLCYTISNLKLSYLDAASACYQNNENLAVLHNTFQANFLASLIRSNSSSDPFWIGLSRPSLGSRFQWDDGTTMLWSNFDPSLQKNDLYVAESTFNGKWMTLNGQQALYFACSYRPGNVNPTYSPTDSPASYPPTGFPVSDSTGFPVSWQPASQTPGYPVSDSTGFPVSWQPASQTPGNPVSDSTGFPVSWQPASDTPGYPASDSTGFPVSWQPASQTPGYPASDSTGFPVSWQPASQTPGYPASDSTGFPFSWQPASDTPGYPVSDSTGFPASVPANDNTGAPVSYPASVQYQDSTGSPVSRARRIA